MEAPAVDEAARQRLERLIYLHGSEHATLLIRTIIESEGNEGALVEPVINAVSWVMVRHQGWTDKGLAWIEAFDSIPLAIVETMRGLDLFQETSLARYMADDFEQQAQDGIRATAGTQTRTENQPEHNRNTPRYTKAKGQTAAGTR